MIYQLVLILMTLFSKFVEAKTAILVTNQSVSQQDYDLILNHKPGLISAISFFEAEKGIITRDLIQETIEISENKEIVTAEKYQGLIKSLTKGIISQIHKNLFLKFYNKHPEILTVSNHEVQLNLFKMNPLNNPGSLINSIKMIRNDDVVIINGFKFSSEDLQKLKFHPKLYYHIAYLSNAFQPHFQFAIGEEIQNPPLVPIIKGDCEKSYVTGFDNTDLTMTLFPNNCLKIASHSEVPLIQIEKQYLNNLEKSESQKNWSKNNTLAFAGSIILVGFLVQETKRQYDISITLPF